jgi:hypothetical protein
MIDISIVSPCPEQVTQEQPNSLENLCSPTDEATNVETRLSFARSRREYDVTVRTTPETIAHIRQLIQLECVRVDRTPTNGACAKMCGSEYCDTFGCMLDQAPPLEGDRVPSAGGVA